MVLRYLLNASAHLRFSDPPFLHSHDARFKREREKDRERKGNNAGCVCIPTRHFAGAMLPLLFVPVLSSCSFFQDSHLFFPPYACVLLAPASFHCIVAHLRKFASVPFAVCTLTVRVGGAQVQSSFPLPFAAPASACCHYTVFPPPTLPTALL